MSENEVARIIRLDKRKQQRAAERIRRHAHECLEIDRLLAGGESAIKFG